MEPKSPKDICVMVVDDQVGMRKIIKTVIQSMGIQAVVEAADGSEALMVLEQKNKHGKGKPPPRASNFDYGKKKIDFIICDWRMPRVSGIELLQAIKADEKLKDIPFMMLTAEGTREEVARALDLGIVDYVIKPFTAQLLEMKLRVAMKLPK